MKLVIAADHGGYKLKHKVSKYLSKKGYNIVDIGTTNINSVDYPDYAFKLGEMIRDKKADIGITICTTGIGMSMSCNKVKGIRCALVANKKDAKLAREHNDANVISIRGTLSYLTAIDIIEEFLKTKFLKKERYQRRINKINTYGDNDGC